MASNKHAFVAAVTVLLLQASWCAVARHHRDQDPCGGDSVLLRHNDHNCSSKDVSSSPQGDTAAMMTVNGFERGQEGGDPAACDGHFHSNKELITALSTGWYAGGKRCHKPIRITSTQTGRSVVASVVDECDSRRGCKNNIVDTSKAVWDALGLDTNVGVVPVTWSDA